MKRILVIDDDPNSAEVAEGFLTGAGYDVSVALDGFVGLKMILSQKPDLVLTDIWMPIGTGLSLVQRLQELGVDDLPVIFMTAARDNGLRQSANQLGVFAFFEKPYNSKELLMAVDWALSQEAAKLRIRRKTECQLALQCRTRHASAMSRA